MGTRSNLDLRRELIQLNIQLDALKYWVDENGKRDGYSSLRWAVHHGGRLPMVVSDILLLEDRRFFRHRGFDIFCIPRAAKRSLKYGRLGGVSTIDQLLARTHSQRRERTLLRKGREILIAVLLNYHRDKHEILLAFVNSAYYGPRLNGADTASKVIFGTDARFLDDRQSAFVASLLPYPLPSNIAQDLRRHGPVSSPDILIRKYTMSNPWWSSRVAARMQYVFVLREKYSIVS